jgi:hypothetical protein
MLDTGYNDSSALILREMLKVSDDDKSRFTIHPFRTVVPTLYRCFSGQRFCDGNAFLLATTDAPNNFVSYVCVCRTNEIEGIESRGYFCIGTNRLVSWPD